MSREPDIEISGYRISRRIGSGGATVVYLGERLGDGTKVALKLYDGPHDATAERRFLADARALARFEHAHIMPILDVGRSADGRPWFAMPHLAHGDLLQRHDRHQPAQIEALLRAVLDALAHAHERGVVHGKLRPSAILFDATNTPWLTDFGAMQSGRSRRRADARYLAPEQLRGLPADGRSDIYALGVILYELLVRHPLERSDTPDGSAANPPPRLPASLKPWQKLIDRSLAPRPEDRFATTREMLAEVDRLAPRLIASDPGAHEHTGIAARAAPAFVAIALALVVVAVMLSSLWWHASRPPLEPASVPMATPAPASQPLAPVDRAGRLVREGNIRLSLGALAEPKGNSAADRFLDALAIDPTDLHAEEGIEHVFNALALRIGSELLRGDGTAALGSYEEAAALGTRIDARLARYWTAFEKDVRSRATLALARATPAQATNLAAFATRLGLALPRATAAAADDSRRASTASSAGAESTPAARATAVDAAELIVGDGAQRFALMRVPVRVADYARFAEETSRKPSRCRRDGNIFSALLGHDWRHPGRETAPSDPVTCVSWNDARAYLAWLSARTGESFRLPSPAEWHAAERAWPELARTPAHSDWLRCSGNCDAVAYTGAAGAGNARPDLGYTTIGFRALRVIDP